MRKTILLPITICVIVIGIVIVIFKERPWKTLPVNSQPGMITIAHYWGYPWNSLELLMEQPGEEDRKYVLRLSSGVSNGEVMSFPFPQLTSGEVSFQLRLYDEQSNHTISGLFSANFQDGDILTDDGLLIYLAK